jgi:hypothetical protein
MNDLPEQVITIFDFIFRFFFNYFWFLVLAIAAIAFFRRKSAHKKMQELAMKLGLQFEDSPHLKEIETRMASMNQQQTTVSPKVLEYVSKAIEFALPLFYQWQLSGKWNDVPVRIYSETDKKNSARYTVVRADTENARAIGLHIVAERFLSTLGNKDITIGNEELDKLILIKTDDPDHAKMLLMSPYLQDAILQAFKFSRAIKIEDQSVTFYHPGNLQNEEKLRAALDHVSRTALALRSASR